MADVQPDTANQSTLFPTSDDARSHAGIVDRLLTFDRRRAGIPGEHLMTAAVGGWLLRSALRRRSPMAMVLSIVAGGLLLARSASGRDGLARFTQATRNGLPKEALQRPLDNA